MLFGFQTERVYVDTRGRNVGVVLVGLHKVEVATLTLGETVVSIELEFCTKYSVGTVGSAFRTFQN